MEELAQTMNGIRTYSLLPCFSFQNMSLEGAGYFSLFSVFRSSSSVEAYLSVGFPTGGRDTWFTFIFILIYSQPICP